MRWEVLVPIFGAMDENYYLIVFNDKNIVQ
jgi:hypothetical protein